MVVTRSRSASGNRAGIDVAEDREDDAIEAFPPVPSRPATPSTSSAQENRGSDHSRLRRTQTADATFSSDHVATIVEALQRSQTEALRSLFESVTRANTSTPVPTVAQPASGNFARCTARFSGTAGDSLDAFLDAANAYKECCAVGDDNAVRGLSLLLTDQAAVWWLGVKSSVTSWSDAVTALRGAFGDRRPPHRIYLELFRRRQNHGERTERFVAEARALLARIPSGDLSEKVQIDMVYGLLNNHVRERMRRDEVDSFDLLLRRARQIEDAMDETRQAPSSGHTSAAGTGRARQPAPVTGNNAGAAAVRAAMQPAPVTGNIAGAARAPPQLATPVPGPGAVQQVPAGPGSAQKASPATSLTTTMTTGTPADAASVVETGDEPVACSARRTLVLANHQSTADVPMLMAAWNCRPGVLPNLMWIMDRVFKFTNFGIVSVLHEDFFIQAGKTKRDQSLEELRQHIHRFYMPLSRQFMVLFPEGGFLHKRREVSQRFAEKNNLPKLEYVSLPRAGAMKVIMEEIGPHRLDQDAGTSKDTKKDNNSNQSRKMILDNDVGDSVEWILDVTIAYPNRVPLHLYDVVCGFRDPCTTHLHYRLYPAIEVPSDTEGMTQWLYDRFVEKDKLLEEYYRTGHFPSKGDAPNVPRKVRQDNLRYLILHLFFLASTILHYNLWCALKSYF